MNSVKTNFLCLKYQRFTPSDCKYIKFRKFEFEERLNFFDFLISIYDVLTFEWLHKKV